MKPMKKSKFLLFCFSFWPGAGEMYLGFFKMGISLMGLFVGFSALCSVLNLDFLLCFPIVIWFYSFFHANHMGGLNDTEFANAKDDYLFGLEALSRGKESAEKYRKWFAFILIGFGAVLLWNTGIEWLVRFLPDEINWIIHRLNYTIPQIIVGLLVIIGGIRLIQGKKQTIYGELSDASLDIDGKTGEKSRHTGEV